jgi:hypothetical protein
MLLHTLLILLLAAAPAIDIHINGSFFMAAELKLRVELIVPVNPDNRMLYVEWVGEGDRASEGLASRQLDEHTDWSRHTFTILLTPGKYYIRGRLLQRDGKQHVTRTATVEIAETLPTEE